jgi:sulfite exporter TauE/SafE
MTAEPSGAGYALAFAGGLAGSLHCLGMCGAFPLALARAPGGRVGRQLLYHLGRLNALAFIGAISGALGATLLAGAPIAMASRVLALGAGVVMVVLGLEMLGLTTALTSRLAVAVNAAVARPLRGVIASPSLAAPLALGCLNAFLPCHLVYAFAAQAAVSGTPLAGMMTMLAFGAGTVPAMFGLGLFGGTISAGVRAGFDRVVAVALIGYGMIVASRFFLDVATTGHVH